MYNAGLIVKPKLISGVPAMDNNLSSQDLEFQAEVRAFFASEYTDDLRLRAQTGTDTKSVAI